MARSIEGLLARIRHPILKRMIAHWDGKCGGRDWPLRSDLDPLEFWFAVGYVSLIDVRPATTPPTTPMETSGTAQGTPQGTPPGGRRYFFRLDGTRQVELFGVDFTGKYLDERADAEGRQVAELSFGAVVDEGKPQYHVRQVEFNERPIQYEIVILPLSRTGERVDMLMTVVTPEAGR